MIYFTSNCEIDYLISCFLFPSLALLLSFYSHSLNF